MKQFVFLIKNRIRNQDEGLEFINNITQATEEGYEIANCGLGGSNCEWGWAIMTRPAEAEKPSKEEDEDVH